MGDIDPTPCPLSRKVAFHPENSTPTPTTAAKGSASVGARCSDPRWTPGWARPTNPGCRNPLRCRNPLGCRNPLLDVVPVSAQPGLYVQPRNPPRAAHPEPSYPVLIASPKLVPTPAYLLNTTAANIHTNPKPLIRSLFAPILPLFIPPASLPLGRSLRVLWPSPTLPTRLSWLPVFSLSFIRIGITPVSHDYNFLTH